MPQRCRPGDSPGTSSESVQRRMRPERCFAHAADAAPSLGDQSDPSSGTTQSGTGRCLSHARAERFPFPKR